MIKSNFPSKKDRCRCVVKRTWGRVSSFGILQIIYKAVSFSLMNCAAFRTVKVNCFPHRFKGFLKRWIFLNLSNILPIHIQVADKKVVKFNQRTYNIIFHLHSFPIKYIGNLFPTLLSLTGTGIIAPFDFHFIAIFLSLDDSTFTFIMVDLTFCINESLLEDREICFVIYNSSLHFKPCHCKISMIDDFIICFHLLMITLLINIFQKHRI